MFDSATGLDSYNKTIHGGHGTLMQNWNEERTLREDLGEGRTVAKFHLSKRHDDLFTKPTSDLQSVYSHQPREDPTFGRVFGRKHEPNYVSEHKEKFSKRTPVKEALQGKKYELIEKQYLDTINQELSETNKQNDSQYNQRFLNTTYINEFAQKDIGGNALGRRVMKDQDGKSLAPETRDEDLLVDHGFLKRSALADEKELAAAVKKFNYVESQPYTFWAEKAKDGIYYTSKATSESGPFTRNNDFLKTFHQYTHIKH